MSWLSKIQAKPREEKIRLIWTIAIIILVVLVIFWIIIGNVNNPEAKDFKFFDQIGQILKKKK